MDQFVHVEFDVTTGHLVCLFKEEPPGCVTKEVLVVIPIVLVLPRSRGGRRYWRSRAGGFSVREGGVADLSIQSAHLTKAELHHHVD